jgi:hypothetical protein
MKKSIEIGSDNDLRNWLFEGVEETVVKETSVTSTVKDKGSRLVYDFERRTNLPGNNRR